MTRFLKPLFLIFGLLLFIWALRKVDLSQVSDLLWKMGPGLLAIVLVYGLVAWFDALSWKYAFKPEEAETIHPFAIWRIRTIGETFNAITPLGTMGGEPVKAHLLKEKYGLTYKQGAASQVVARTTLTVSLILFMIPGIVFLFMDKSISETFKISSLTGLITFSILIFLFLLFQITGTLSRMAHGFNRLFPSQTPRPSLEHLVALCGMMSGYYRQHRGLFLKSIAFGFLGWVAGVLELYLTLYFLGVPVGFKELWIIESLLQLVRAGSFFIPLSLGAQEGGIDLDLHFHGVGRTSRPGGVLRATHSRTGLGSVGIVVGLGNELQAFQGAAGGLLKS